MTRISPLTRKATWAVLLATLACFSGEAQTTSGSISGTVVDTQQASISGAATTVTEPSKGITRRTLTNDAGGFVFAQLPPVAAFDAPDGGAAAVPGGS